VYSKGRERFNIKRRGEMKIELNEIWHTKIATTTKEAVDNVIMLEEMGISTSIADEEVRYIDYWIPYRWIKSVEDSGHGNFNITLRDGEVINSKENPFNKEER